MLYDANELLYILKARGEDVLWKVKLRPRTKRPRAKDYGYGVTNY